MMKCNKYTIGLLLLITTACIDLNATNEDNEMSENIKQKILIYKKYAKQLNDEEKTFLYKEDLLKNYNLVEKEYKEISKTKIFSKIGELSFLANELSDFYKAQNNEEQQKHYDKIGARLILESALYGSYDHFTYIYSLYQQRFLPEEDYKFVEGHRTNFDDEGDQKKLEDLSSLLKSDLFTTVSQKICDAVKTAEESKSKKRKHTSNKSTKNSAKNVRAAKKRKYNPYTDNDIIEDIIDRNYNIKKEIK